MDANNYRDGGQPDAGPMETFQPESSSADDQSLHDAPESTGANFSSQGKPVSDHYKMNHGDRGWALIINNRKFAEEEVEERHGTDLDLKKMLSVLRDNFGFKKEQVKHYHNVKREKMKDLIIEAAAKNYTDCDCFVCVILSYGTSEGEIYGSDRGNPVSLAELMEPLKGKEFQPSKSLIGKPKMFFIQACPLERKGIEEFGADLGEDVESEMEVMEAAKIPTEADFFIASSSVPGSLTRKGSWFIQTLNEVVKAKCETDDLLSMLTKVNNKFLAKFENPDNAQVPHIMSTLTKKVFFKRNISCSVLDTPRL